jgi:putative acetyltransferase
MTGVRGEIEIVPYQDEFRADFRRLNLAWLDKYGLTETHDLQMLEDPGTAILAKGGRIFLALEGGTVVGTAALLKGEGGDYELAKMAVDPGSQGQGLGRKLLERCLQEAENLKAGKIFLFSNTRLAVALKLYEKFGFRRVPVTGAPFVTADVKMELVLLK